MGAPVRRIELWEPEVHTGNPLAFNAVITEAGVVDVQQVEWQIEHRYHFILEPAVTASLFAAFATLSPSSPPEDAKILMFIGDEGQRRGFASRRHKQVPTGRCRGEGDCLKRARLVERQKVRLTIYNPVVT